MWCDRGGRLRGAAAQADARLQESPEDPGLAKSKHTADEALRVGLQHRRLLEVLARQLYMIRNILSHQQGTGELSLDPCRARFVLEAYIRFFRCLLHMSSGFPSLVGWADSGDAAAANLVRRVLEVEAWAQEVGRLWVTQCRADLELRSSRSDLLLNYPGDEESSRRTLWRRAWHFLSDPDEDSEELPTPPGSWPSDWQSKVLIDCPPPPPSSLWGVTVLCVTLVWTTFPILCSVECGCHA